MRGPCFRSRWWEVCRAHSGSSIGLGVCNPRSAEIESVDFIVRKVQTLLQHRRPEQIYLNPDCGFGTFAERPVNTADVAAEKLRAIHQAAEVLRAEYA